MKKTFDIESNKKLPWSAWEVEDAINQYRDLAAGEKVTVREVPDQAELLEEAAQFVREYSAICYIKGIDTSMEKNWLTKYEALRK